MNPTIAPLPQSLSADVAFTLQEIVIRRGELDAERKTRSDEHKRFLETTAAELEKLASNEALIVGGLDLAKIERGRQLIAIEGIVGKVVQPARYMSADSTGVRSKALTDAKADLAAGGTKIASRYFGVKNYSAFGDQREDHEYGMGPRHGCIVFRIGLTRNARDQIKSGQPLLAEQIDAALYLLSSLPKIEQLQFEREAATCL